MFAAQDVALPGLTRGLLALSAAFVQYGVYWVMGLALFIGGAVFFLRSETGNVFSSWVQMKFGLYRLHINVQLARVCVLMLDAGQTLGAAINMCAKISQNKRVVSDFEGIDTALAAGTPFWSALGEITYIEASLVGMCRVGEDSGRLSATLAACLAHLQDEYSRRLRRLSKLAEPIITIVLGVLMALVMLAVVLPTFELATAI
jgi:type II secretory pathway component PulF